MALGWPVGPSDGVKVAEHADAKTGKCKDEIKCINAVGSVGLFGGKEVSVS